MRSIDLSEQISDLYECVVSSLCSDSLPEVRELLGLEAHLSIDRGEQMRTLHGIVKHASVREHESGSLIVLHIVPALWLLEENTRSRTFTNQTIPEVVELVFNERLSARNRTLRNDLTLRLRLELEDGRSRGYGYNANGGLRRVDDLDGGRWKLEHASWNHIVAEIDPNDHRTSYEWSSTESLTAVVDASGTRTDYVRDLKDQVTELWRHDRMRERYLRDAAGHLIQKRGAAEEVLLDIERDPAGRVLTRELASGDTHTLRWDGRGRLVEANTRHFKCRFAYDARDRRVLDERDGKGVRQRFGGSRLASTTVLERFVTEYHELDGGKVTVVVDPAGGTHRLRSHGRGVFTTDFANGLSETTQYEPRAGRVLSKVLYPRDAPSRAWARRFEFSGEGDLVRRLDSERGPTEHEHDAAHRLVATRHPDGRRDEYGYNAAGTLSQSPTLTQATVGRGNLLRVANGERLEYDERDRLARRTSDRGTLEFDYDSLDQLSVIFWQGADGRRWGWDTDHDPLGRRVHKAPGYAKMTRYYWDGDRLMAEVFPDGRLRVYVYADAFAVVPLLFIDYASEDAAPESGERYYLITDQRGCPERVLDDAGAVVWQAQVDPYGHARVEIGHGFHQPLRTPGHLFDPETGLHYNRFRVYDPMMGRYLQPDPWGLKGGLNLYAYTRSPLTQWDVRGLGCGDPEPSTADGEQPDQHPAGEGEGEASAGAQHPAELDEHGRLAAPEGWSYDENNRLHDDTGAFARHPDAPPQAHSRATEYPSGYRQETHATMVARHTLEGQASAAATGTSGNPNGDWPTYPNDHPRAGERMDRRDMTWIDSDGGIIDDPTYEHVVPVVEHFNDGMPGDEGTRGPPGRDSSRADRFDFYNDTNNLAVKSRSENSRGGSESGLQYSQDVGDNYSNDPL